MIDVHLIEGKLKDYVGLATIIHEDLVELPSSYITLDDHCIDMRSTSQVHSLKHQKLGKLETTSSKL